MNPSSPPRAYRFSVLRVLFCGVLMTALVAASLYLYHTSFAFLLERLREAEMKTTAWIFEQVSFSLPFILICLFHWIVYWKHDRRDGVAQREMAWEVVLVTLLTYGVLLPLLADYSHDLLEAAQLAGSDIPHTEGKVDVTLLQGFVEWFLRLTVPLVILMTFHGMRASRERRCPDVPEVPETVEAYLARTAPAEVPADTSAEVPAEVPNHPPKEDNHE